MTDDDNNTTFAAACQAADEKKAQDLGAELTRKLQEQRTEQEARLKDLAAKDLVSYDQQRKTAAEELGIRTTTLDKEIERLRRQRPSGTKKQEDDGSKIKEFEQAAGDLVGEPNVLDRFSEAVQACGLVGEDRNAKILFLAHTTRLFERPVSIAIKGISSGGKSFTVETVLKFFPDEAFFVRTGMSEHALPYSDEDFKHRHIVLFEHVGMSSDTASYFIRTLLSENNLTYEVVQKIDGELKAVVLTKEGPTGLITTTTAAALHPENETRLLSLGVIDSPEQTHAILRAIGRRAARGEAGGSGVDLERWQAFQRWLALGEKRVIIPFAEWLGVQIPPVAVRLRRDYTKLLSLIEAHALLHRRTRATDQRGRIIATAVDYAAVYDLVERFFAEGVEATVRPIVRETVEAVRRMAQPEGVSLTAIAKILGLDKNTVHNRLRKAFAAGYLVNEAEGRKGAPARIVLGDPLPEERPILPAPETLEGGCWSVGGDSGGKDKQGDISNGTPPSGDPDHQKPTEISQKSTAETEKEAESGRLPEGTFKKPSLPASPPTLASNSPTVAPNGGGNGHAPPPLCDNCGNTGKLTPYDWPHRPDGIILHSSCEGPWFDSGGRRR